VASRSDAAAKAAAVPVSSAGPAQRTLEVLIVGTDDWAIEQSAAAIEAAGHAVHRCHEAGEAPFPCNALRPGRGCPLDKGIDVIVASRARPVDAPTTTEMGVTCALHAGVPLVLTGISRGAPFAPYAAEVVAVGGDVAAACADAAGDESLTVVLPGGDG
jgi:hypothetical protein